MLAAEFMDIQRPTPEHELLIAICERAVKDLLKTRSDLSFIEFVSAREFIYGDMRDVLVNNFDVDPSKIDELINKLRDYEQGRAKLDWMDEIPLRPVWERPSGKDCRGKHTLLNRELLHLCRYDQNLAREYREKYTRVATVNSD